MQSNAKKPPHFPAYFFRLAVIAGALAVAILLEITVYGYLTGRPSLVYGLTEFGKWRNTTKLIWEFLTAAFAIRVALSFAPRYRIDRNEFPRLLLGGLLVGTLLLFRALVANDSEGISAASRSQARSIGKQFLMTIDDPTLALDRMADRWSSRGGMPEKEWKVDASRMLAHFPGLFIYSRIDAQGIIRWVYPEENAPKYIGQSVFDSPTRGSFFLQAKAAKALVFSKVMNLRFGGVGFGAVAPLWKNEVFNGALSYGIRLEGFFNPAIEPGDFRVVFSEDGKPFYTLRSDAPMPTDDPEQLRRWRGFDTVEFRNLKWEIAVYPLNETLIHQTSALPIVVLVIGFILALLGAELARLNFMANQARAQARDALAWQEAIVNGSDLAIMSTDARGILKSFNPAAERLLGYRESEVCDLVTPNLWYDPREIIARAEELSLAYGKSVTPGFDTLVERTRNGEVDRHEWTFLRKDGVRRAVSTSVHALYDGAEISGYVWMVEDLTVKKSQALKISEQQALMLHSSKLAALGEMAAGVAHEINNPLLVIAGKVEQVKRLYDKGTAERESVFTHMDSIRGTVDRIAKIISGLRTFARDSGGEPYENASVRKIVDETVALCAERFKNHSIEFRVGPVGEFEVRCRPYQIAQVLLNLLNNAFDAASVGRAENRWVSLETKIDDSVAEISVSDSGDGVTRAIREKIMLPFFTTKEVGKGTGLGLSISQGIMADHGGTLVFDPAAPNTRFVVRIPLAGSATFE